MFADPEQLNPEQLNPEHLNSEQRAAVFHDGTPLLIVAGAGTGKTKTLVQRVVRLIDDGVDPNRILLLTFTRRAASEMLGRVTASSTSRAAAQVWGGTFHATANRLLRTAGQGAGLRPDFTVLDQSDSVDLFGMVRNAEGFGERSRRFPRKATIANVYGRMVNSQAKLDDVLETDYPWIAEHADDLRTIFAAYTAKKREQNVLDYDDLLLFWRAVASRGAGGLRAMFDHILIDEYQDTNPIQVDIVRAMVGPTTQVCAVGDDAQAIYGFRSATVENMWRFPDQFEGAATITLEQNYRSTTPILTAANAVLGLEQTDDPTTGERSALTRHLRKELWSARSGGAMPELAVHHDEGDQSRSVADAILDARERGLDLRDQAVLFRTGHHADHLELELTRRDIPYVKYGGLKYLESAHVKDLLSLLRVLENDADELAWHRVFDSIEGVGPATSRRLVEELAIADRGVDSIERLLDGSVRMPKVSTEHTDALRTAFAECRATTPPADQINSLRSFCAEVFPHRYENAAARLADIDQLAATALQYPSRSRLLTELTLDPPGKTGDLAGPPHKDDDWLTLTTIHSAKGCEWRAVHLLHAADGNIPSDMAIGDQAGLAEELRLLYVALTRAKDELSVHVPLRYHVNRHGHDDRHLYAQMSRFLEPVRHLFDETSAQTPAIDLTEPTFAVDGAVTAEVDASLADLWS